MAHVDPETPDGRETLGELRRQFTALKTETYGSYRTAVAEDADFYELKFDRRNKILPDEWRKEGIDAIIPPTAYNSVENASDHILVTPRLRIPERPSGADQRAQQEIAERKREWGRAWWDHIAVYEGDPMSQGVKRLVKDGKVVIKKEIRWESVPDAPEGVLGLDRFLWDIKAPPPETIYEQPDKPHDPDWLYEAREVRADTVKKLFPEAQGPKNKADNAMVEWVEYWLKPHGEDEGLYVIWLDREPVVVTANPYRYETAHSHALITNEETGALEDGPADWTGYIPYHIRPSGWGERTSDNDPSRLYVGILRRMHSILVAEAKHITAASAQMLIATFPLIKAFNIGEDEDLEVGLGKILHLDSNADQDVDVVKWPGVPNEVFRILESVNNWANDLSKFGTLGGGALPGIDTATEADQTLRNATAKLQRPVNALRSIFAAMMEQAFLDVDRILEWPVALAGTSDEALIMLTPEDIDGFYMASVELSTTDKAALDRMLARLWFDAYNSVPGLSMETVMENAGIDEPQKEMLQRADEDVFFGPEQKLMRTQLSLAALGTIAVPLQQALMQNLGQRLGGGDPDPGGANAAGDQPKSTPAPETRTAEIQQTSKADAQTNQADRENT